MFTRSLVYKCSYNFIHNNEKLKIAQVSINSRMDKEKYDVFIEQNTT